MTEFDHLIVGCASLEQGIEHLEQLTGVTAVRGGAHVAMGTHNAVARLGERSYLELIAIDPHGKAPARPRWFELDAPSMRASLADAPRPIGWAARTDDLDAALARATVALGTTTPMARADYRWRITIPDDGRRPEGGVAPVLIEWEGPLHPALRLPASGLSLASLTLAHPSPDVLRALLVSLGLRDAATVAYAKEPRVAALLRTPRGLVAL